MPAHVVTPGLAILATLSDGALEAWVKQHEFSAFTPCTITVPEAFLRGIALAVKNRKGECVGAIGSTLPMQSLSRDEVIASMLTRLTDVAQVLREVL